MTDACFKMKEGTLMLICLYRALTSENPTQQHFPLTEEAFTKASSLPRSPSLKKKE